MNDFTIKNFIQRQRELLQLELKGDDLKDVTAATITASSSSSETETPRRVRTTAMATIQGLDVFNVSVALYKRTVVVLWCRAKLLPTHKFDIGDEVEIRSTRAGRRSSSFTTDNSGPRGVVSHMTETSISIALWGKGQNTSYDPEEALSKLQPPLSLFPKKSSSTEDRNTLVSSLKDLGTKGVYNPDRDLVSSFSYHSTRTISYHSTQTMNKSATSLLTMEDDNEEEDYKKVVHYPANYEVPEVWTFAPQDGVTGHINRHTAGSRFEQRLPTGKHPLQLYSLGTPNGVKVTILLEELCDLDPSFDYDAWKISIFDLEQFGSDFVDINPNSKIPALSDHSHDPPIRIFESGNILRYLCDHFDKTDSFLPTNQRDRTECFNWLFWQTGGAPYIGGGFGHFYKYAPNKIEYAIDRYAMETKRQFDVLDKQLEGKEYVIGGSRPTIADFAIWPWVDCCRRWYDAETFLRMKEDYPNVMVWLDRIGKRPAVQRGMRVNGAVPNSIDDRHSRADFVIHHDDDDDTSTEVDDSDESTSRFKAT